MNRFWNIWESIMGWVYPEICQGCHAESAGRSMGYVGWDCRMRLGNVEWITEVVCETCGLPFEGVSRGTFKCSDCRDETLAVDRSRSAVVANHFIRNLIHRYKYGKEEWVELFLAELMVTSMERDCFQQWDYVVPVPLHPVKRRERGFNQAERLGEYVARTWGKPIIGNLLERVNWTETQTWLDRPSRTANVRGAFRVREGLRGRVEGKKILLIDDVLTTGATTRACSEVLRRAGVNRIEVRTVARGMRLY